MSIGTKWGWFNWAAPSRFWRCRRLRPDRNSAPRRATALLSSKMARMAERGTVCQVRRAVGSQNPKVPLLGCAVPTHRKGEIGSSRVTAQMSNEPGPPSSLKKRPADQSSAYFPGTQAVMSRIIKFCGLSRVMYYGSCNREIELTSQHSRVKRFIEFCLLITRLICSRKVW